MPKYLALSIGPIYKTLQQARKTRELWAASYLFSHLMENLTAELGTDNIVMPVVQPDKSKPGFGAGLFPDRLLMNADGLTDESVVQKINLAIEKTAKAVFPGEKLPPVAIPYWKQFFRIAFVLREYPEMTGKIFIEEIVPILDAAELGDAFFHETPENDFLLELLLKVYQTPIATETLKSANSGRYQNLLVRKLQFASTREVASFELFELDPTQYFIFRQQVEEEDPEDKKSLFYRSAEKHERWDTIRRPYHKYFCIVHADGDGIGKAIGALKSENEFRSFSQKLNDFGSAAAHLIDDFGGKPVYIGGDDLLFITPVRTQKGSVLDLIHALDQSYMEQNLTTLSFGLSICYYKFPLFEARNISAEQLFDVAKNFQHGGQVKNAVSVAMIKHSGNQFGAVFSKHILEKLIEATKSLQSESSEAKSDRDELLSSLIFKLRTLEGLLDATLRHATPDTRSERITAFLETYFDTGHTAGKNLEQQRATIAALILAAWSEKAEKDERNWLDNLYCTLRLLKFITDKQ